MSKEVKEEKRVVTLQELLVRANQLRDSLILLESQLNNYNVQLNELKLIRETISNVSNGLKCYLLLDRLTTLFLPVTIEPGWSENVVLNIGRNIYMKTTRDKALEIVNDRINNLNRIIMDLSRQYRALLEEYNLINQILASIYAQLEKKRESREPSKAGA
ncbi:MAG: prefoldin domain-containing protein [Desulfurococcaceae archaeon]|uniref:Prefoldin subunit alpha n=1 Tax=Staphylothermus marinus TaxID=2280 RepID=A0A7C4JLD3_STAMA